MGKNVSILVLIIFSILIISNLSAIAADNIMREDEINDVLDEEFNEVSRPNIDIYKISCSKDGDEVEVKLQLVSNGKIQNSEFSVYTIVLTTDINEYSIVYNNNDCLIEDADFNEIEVKSYSGVGSNTLQVVFDLSKSSEECLELAAYTMEFSLTAYYMDIYPNEDFEFLVVDAGGPYSGYVNEPVEFSGSAENETSAYEWYWEFGDGESSEEKNPSHIYEESGTYEVSLIVSDPDTGKAGFDNTTVTIVELPYNISGKIYYNGSQNKKIFVWLYDKPPAQDTPPVGGLSLPSPGDYTIQVPNGTYYLAAFMDVDEKDRFNGPVGFGDCVDVRYIGRFQVNNTIFDTNYEDIAKNEGLYNDSYSYDPLKVFINPKSNLTIPIGYEEYDSDYLSCGYSIPSGFLDGLVGMKVGDNKTVVLEAEDAYGDWNSSLAEKFGMGSYPLETVIESMITENKTALLGSFPDINLTEGAIFDYGEVAFEKKGVLNASIINVTDETVTYKLIPENGSSVELPIFNWTIVFIVENDTAFTMRSIINEGHIFSFESFYGSLHFKVTAVNETHAKLAMNIGAPEIYFVGQSLIFDLEIIKAYDTSNPVYPDISNVPFGYAINKTISEGADAIDINGNNIAGVNIILYEDIELLEVDAGGPYSGYVNEPVEFSGSAENETSAYEWYWDFGDGESSEERNPSHIYEESGTYEVSLIVSDPDTGRAGFDNCIVFISANGGNNHPAANPGGLYYGNINEPIQFCGSGVRGTPPYTYEWDFDKDGNTDSTLQNPTYSWSDAGTYHPTLRVTDSNGLSSGLKECRVDVTDSLLDKYAPILYFYEGEKYYPTTIYAMLSNSNLKSEEGSILVHNPELEDLLIYNDENNYLDMDYTWPPDSSVFKGYSSNIYARKKTINGGTALQYWFFYPFNDGLVNDHEGDWEKIQILLDSNRDPYCITYSWHVWWSSFGYAVGGKTYDWADIWKEDNHPKVFVEKGGHANNAYYAITKSFEKIIYPKGVHLEQSIAEQLKYQPEIYDTFEWVQWKGRWGEVTGKLGENGVPGPKHQKIRPLADTVWDDPVGWANWCKKGYYSTKDWLYFKLLGGSPVNFHIYNQYDNHVGIDENGTFECDIPGVFFTDLDNPVIYILNSSIDNYYRVIVEATGEGNFSLDIEQGKYNKTAITQYQNVSIMQNSTAVLYLNRTTANYTMYIDYDGDNVTDEEKSPDSIEMDYAPNATIISPVNNSIYLYGDEITFNSNGTDFEDGLLTNLSFMWISSIDGLIYIGNEFNTTNLSAGTHIIELLVNDSSSQIDIDNITITIFAPDLMIDASNISFSNPCSIEGETITINATIYNIGTANATDITVQFYDGNPLNGKQIGANLMIPSLNASENKTMSVFWDTIGESGDNCIWVVVDPSDVIMESDKKNNRAYKVIYVNAPTLLHIIQARTNNPIYLEGKEVLISCSVQNASGNISANVSASIEKPDGVVDNIKFIEEPIGKYNGIFTNTSLSGLYNITIYANQTGFTDDYESLSFEILDTIPPSSITNITNTTNTTWINWSWDNPSNSDFDHSLIYLDRIWKTATSNGYYLAEELNPNTKYEIAIRTVDKAGNINETWVNQTTKTMANIPPTADFTWTPTNPEEEETITFTDITTQGNGDIQKWFWEFGDGDISTDQNPTHNYSVAGTYTVTLIVTDSNGLSDSKEKNVTMLTTIVTSLSPMDDADADWTEPNTNYGTDPYLYVESRTNAGPRVSYVKFDLSNIPSGVMINSASFKVYVYGQLFLNYLFLGTVSNSWDEDTLTWNNNPGLSSDIDWVYVSSTDRWYSWDVTSKLQSALPDDAISFNMVLEDGAGVIFMYSKEMGLNPPTIDVEYFGETPANIPPNASVDGPYSGYVNEQVTFDASGSTDSDGSITGYRWDFDSDGVYDTGWLSSLTTKYIYTAADTYNVILQVIDNFGAKDTDTTTVTVKEKLDNGGNGGDDSNGGGGPLFIPPPPQNIIPRADAGGPYYGFIDEEISFDGSKSSDDGMITNYTWDFGDKTSGYGVKPTHAYANPGRYTVSLTVTDDLGAVNQDNTIAEISVPNKIPSTPIIDGSKDGTQNTEYIFTALSTDEDNDTIQYHFNWGDGTTNITEFLPNGTATIQMHIWTAAGKYIITVQAHDNKTPSDTSSYTVLIDTHIVENIGYITDDDADGTYDTFHGDIVVTDLGIEGGKYLIDSTGDGDWDYTYNLVDGLAVYKKEVEEIEAPWAIVGIIIVILIVAFIVLTFRKK